MKRFIAVIGASALLVVGTAFVVQAQTMGGILPCADLAGGSGTYTPPAENALGVQTSAGELLWDMDLKAASCSDVVYGLTVFMANTDGEASPLLASASTPGDTVSDTLTFQLEVNTNNAGSICVVQTTVGGGSTPPTSPNNGAAFDADGAGSTLLDRGPDGPAGGDIAPGGDIYCIEVDQDGSGSRTAG